VSVAFLAAAVLQQISNYCGGVAAGARLQVNKPSDQPITVDDAQTNKDRGDNQKNDHQATNEAEHFSVYRLSKAAAARNSTHLNE
jgi:hypothetical protein